MTLIKILPVLCLLVVPILAQDARSLAKNCDSSYSTTCFKLDVVNFVEKVSGRSSEVSIFPGLSLVKDKDVSGNESSEKVAELARSFPNDPEQRVDQYLIYKIGSFLNSHSLRFKLMDDETSQELGRELESARHGLGGMMGGNRRKKKGGMHGVMLMGMMMKGALGAIALGGIAFIAGKALIASLIALVLSGILGFRSLTGGNNNRGGTYEIIAKQPMGSYNSPVGDYSNGAGVYDDKANGYNHQGYARSLDIKLPEHLATTQP